MIVIILKNYLTKISIKNLKTNEKTEKKDRLE